MEVSSSIIQAVGAIISSALGAYIAGGYISRSLEKNISPLFTTYSDEAHDVTRLLKKAKENIYVVVSVGDRFLETYEKTLEKYLKKGVHLRFLMHNNKYFLEFERYINNKKPSDYVQYIQVRYAALEILRRLKSKYPGQVEVREFDAFLTASYIGIDIEERETSPQWLPHAGIQVMLYQYGIDADKSPITYFSLKNNKRLFESTANSISEMWYDGIPVPTDNG